MAPSALVVVLHVYSQSDFYNQMKVTQPLCWISINFHQAKALVRFVQKPYVSGHLKGKIHQILLTALQICRSGFLLPDVTEFGQQGGRNGRVYWLIRVSPSPTSLSASALWFVWLPERKRWQWLAGGHSNRQEPKRLSCILLKPSAGSHDNHVANFDTCFYIRTGIQSQHQRITSHPVPLMPKSTLT